jgi:hypothetical protein
MFPISPSRARTPARPEALVEERAVSGQGRRELGDERGEGRGVERGGRLEQRQVDRSVGDPEAIVPGGRVVLREQVPVEVLEALGRQPHDRRPQHEVVARRVGAEVDLGVGVLSLDRG